MQLNFDCMKQIEIAIIGGGPCGLAVAVEAQKAGFNAVVFEKGTVAENIRHFPTNMVFFSTADLLQIGDLPFTIPHPKPTRAEAVAYYQKVAQFYYLDVRTNTPIVSVQQTNNGFVLEDSLGRLYASKYVVVATGYFENPNRLDVPGESLPFVKHRYEEALAYWGKKVVIVGGGNSAVEAALEIYRVGAKQVIIIHRRKEFSPSVKYWLKPDIENRIREGSITAYMESTVKNFVPGGVVIQTPNGEKTIECDEALILIGYTPNIHLLRRFGVPVDEKTKTPLYNPETMETQVAGLYVAGSVVCGCETGNIFIENGRLHARIIISHIKQKQTDNKNFLGDSKLVTS